MVRYEEHLALSTVLTTSIDRSVLLDSSLLAQVTQARHLLGCAVTYNEIIMLLLQDLVRQLAA